MNAPEHIILEGKLYRLVEWPRDPDSVRAVHVNRAGRSRVKLADVSLDPETEQKFALTPEKRRRVEQYAVIFDGLFTIAAVAWVILALVWMIRGNADRMIADLTLGLVFWIASTQLAPYWSKDAPERCKCREGDR